MDNQIIFKILEGGFFAAMAAIGFSTISHTPRRTFFVCAVAAAAGYSVRSLLMLPGGPNLNIIAAATAAALVIGFIAVLLAPVVKVPAEACLFPALLPMIPGMYAYRTVEGLVGCLKASQEAISSHYLYMFGYNGLMTISIILAMTLGATIPIFLLKKVSFRATR